MLPSPGAVVYLEHITKGSNEISPAVGLMLYACAYDLAADSTSRSDAFTEKEIKDFEYMWPSLLTYRWSLPIFVDSSGQREHLFVCRPQSRWGYHLLDHLLEV